MLSTVMPAEPRMARMFDQIRSSCSDSVAPGFPLAPKPMVPATNNKPLGAADLHRVDVLGRGRVDALDRAVWRELHCDHDTDDVIDSTSLHGIPCPGGDTRPFRRDTERS